MVVWRRRWSGGRAGGSLSVTGELMCVTRKWCARTPRRPPSRRPADSVSCAAGAVAAETTRLAGWLAVTVETGERHPSAHEHSVNSVSAESRSAESRRSWHITRKWCALELRSPPAPPSGRSAVSCFSCAHLEHRGCGGRPTGAAETTRLGGDGWASAESRLSLLTCCRVRSETSPPARAHALTRKCGGRSERKVVVG